MSDERERVVAAAAKALAAPSFGGTMTCSGGAGPGYTKEFVRQGDACALTGPGLLVVLPGEELTSITGDRWSRRTFGAGAWHREDPAYPLHVLVAGCTGATSGEERYAAANLKRAIDRDVAHDLREDGFDPSWPTVTGHVGVSGFGEVLEVSLRLVAGSVWQEWRWDVRWYDVPLTLERPDPERTIEQAAWFAEQDELRDRTG